MPSPFPGMNPFLEQDAVWNDFHQGFIALVRENLTPQVRPRYIVRLEEHLYVHELPDGTPRRFLGRPDVSLSPSGVTGARAPTVATVLAAPALVSFPAVDVERLSYLEIRDRETREVVTALELLSPSNKYAGPDREQFLTKRNQLLASRVNYVEIDLLRGGPRLPLHDLPGCDYYAVVSSPELRPDAGLWPIRLRDPLPTIPIPLRGNDPDASLDLQQILHRAYDAAGYDLYIYQSRPEPQLRAEDADWAEPFIPGRPV